MITGTRRVAKPLSQALDHLRMVLAGAGCETEILEEGRLIRFRHGTYLTQTAPLLPKEGTLTLSEAQGVTQVHYRVHARGPIRIYMIIIAVLFCWTVFVPLLVHRALVHHPRKFVENLLAGV